MSITVNPNIWARTSINRAVCCGCPAPEFASMYEAKQALSTVQKSRFVCYFTGDCPNPSWIIKHIVGTGNIAHPDGINCGLRFTSGTPNCSRSYVEWCDIRHFDGCGTGMVVISVAKYCNCASGFSTGVFNDNGDMGSSLNRNASIQEFTTITNMRGLTGDGAVTSGTDLCVARDGNYHSFKMEINACDTEFTVDGGCVDGTGSCRQVAAQVGPYLAVVRFSSGGAKTANWLYYEAYNK